MGQAKWAYILKEHFYFYTLTFSRDISQLKIEQIYRENTKITKIRMFASSEKFSTDCTMLM